MIQDEIRPNLDGIIGQSTHVIFPTKIMQGRAVGVTIDGQIVIEPRVSMNASSQEQSYQIGENQGLRIQAVEYIHSNDIPFIEGNVIECISNHRRKNKSEDVKKAIQLCVMLLKLDYGFTQEELKEVFNGVK